MIIFCTKKYIYDNVVKTSLITPSDEEEAQRFLHWYTGKGNEKCHFSRIAKSVRDLSRTLKFFETLSLLLSFRRSPRWQNENEQWCGTIVLNTYSLFSYISVVFFNTINEIHTTLDTFSSIQTRLPSNKKIVKRNFMWTFDFNASMNVCWVKDIEEVKCE